jgi:hypothetical protein
MISATVVVKSVAGALWRAVRRSPGASPPAADSNRFLTIGALTVVTPETPSVPGVPTSRRSIAISALLGTAGQLLLARYVLARALERLETNQLLELLDQVDNELYGDPTATIRPLFTVRDDSE